MQNSLVRSARLALYTIFLVCAACGSKDSPEAQIHAVIRQMEAAAEARATGDLMEFISPDFRGDYAQNRDELSRLLRGYFIANQSVHLLTRIERMEFPSPDEARADISVAMVGREADAAHAWNLAAELHDFHVALRHEDGDWKVTYAAAFAPH